MPGPVVVTEEAPSELTREKWVFSYLDGHLVLERYHYERRRAKSHPYKTMKLYDRGKTNGEEYGDWAWLKEDDVPWDSDVQGQALAELSKQIKVGRWGVDFGQD